MEGIVTRAVFVRAVAAVYAVAVVSLWVQVDGLIGPDGILPLGDFLARAASHLGLERFWALPTLLWFLPSDLGPGLLCAAGVALALAVVVGTPVDGVLLAAMWAIYLSLIGGAQIFLGFQWDTLLVEVVAVAALWSPWLPGPPRPPSTPARWLAYWVVFKLFFFGGLVKLTSGDPTWRDGTALTFHYWTQPLPNPVSWYADQLPDTLHALSQWVMFGIELALPFAVFAGAAGRRLAFGPFVVLLGLLALTGNYGFFQLLGAVLCLSLLDDDTWRRVLPERALARLAEPTEPPRHLATPLIVVLVLTSLLFAVGFDRLPGWGQAWARLAYPFHTANSYGLFAVMTTERPVVVFETSRDGVIWEPLWLPHQTGPVDRRPSQVAPHMPRLDWQLWFAALGDCRRNPWVLRTQIQLSERSAATWGLFGVDPPDGDGPLRVRTTRWSYRFAAPGSADWYVRDDPQPYCPAVPPGPR